METRRYRTDLRCQGCLASLAEVLNSAPGVTQWTADVDTPEKPLTITGERVDATTVSTLLGKAGYHVLGELPLVATTSESAQSAPANEEKPVSYYPLFLVTSFLLLGTLLLQLRAGQWNTMHAMSDFMGLFFLTFAFFKLLDVPAFATAYAGYDILAQRRIEWGYLYPFVEAGLGVAYLTMWNPLVVNLLTALITGLGSIGVLRTLLARRKIRCACLGTGFNLPMSVVSLIEDVGMMAMALIMVFLGSH
jgi:copper chaperone CopZ